MFSSGATMRQIREQRQKHRLGTARRHELTITIPELVIPRLWDLLVIDVGPVRALQVDDEWPRVSA